MFGVPLCKGNKMVGSWGRPRSHCLPAIAFSIFGTFWRTKLAMNYLAPLIRLFDPSLATSKASHNPWDHVTKEEQRKLDNASPECKRTMECMKWIGPILEGVSHRMLVEDFWMRIMWRFQALIALLLLLFVLGGASLAYQVATAKTYSQAADAVFDILKHDVGDAGSSFDPGPPGWLETGAKPPPSNASSSTLAPTASAPAPFAQ